MINDRTRHDRRHDVHGLETASFETNGVIHIRAAAGSGKTTQLVERYLGILLHEAASPDAGPYGPAASILALTFANKASKEMKQRILGALKERALAQERDRSSLRPGDGGVSLVRIIDDLLRRYHLFQVQTIDSFVNTLLVVSSFQLGLTNRFEVSERVDRYLTQALDTMLNRFERDRRVREALEGFLQHHLMQPTAGWFAVDDLRDVMRRMFTDWMIYGRCDEAVLRDETDPLAFKKKAAAALKALVQDPPEGLNQSKLNAVLRLVEKTKDLSFTVKDLPAVLGRPDPPWNQSCVLDPAQKAVFEKKWRRCHDELGRWVEADARLWFRSHHALFALFLDELHRLKTKADVVFLEELNRLAEPLLAQGQLPPSQIALQLGTRLRHILMDECQDTSPLQWANIKPLMDEVLAQGGSVFLVGDEKQSIYGFRGSDPKLFHRLEEYFPQTRVRVRRLAANWRSAPQIVNFNNRVFDSGHLRWVIDRISDRKGFSILEEDKLSIAAAYETSRQTAVKTEAGWVRIEDVPDEEGSRSFLTKTIEEIRRLGGDYGDAAVLTRSNTEAETVTAWLMQDGIPVVSERTCDIRRHPLIQEILALLRFLASPVDSRSLAEFMLGDLFAAASEWETDRVQAFLFEAGVDERTPLYIRLQKQHPEVWQEIFDVFFRKAGVFPAYEYITAIIGRFDVLHRFPHQAGFVMQFLEFVRNRSRETPDLNGFLGHEDLVVDDRSVPPADAFVSLPAHPQAVRVMTVHKAKGLQFPVVILPFLGLTVDPYGPGQRPCERVVSEGGWRYYEMSQGRIHFSPRLKRMYEQACGRALHETLNVLYVALTRAQRAVYAAVPKKIGRSNNLLEYLIPAERSWRRIGKPVSLRSDRPEAERQKEGPAPSEQMMPPITLKDWVQALVEEWPLETDAFARFRQRRRGERLHALMAEALGAQAPCSSEEARECCECRAHVSAVFPGLPPEERDWLVKQRHRLVAEPAFAFLRRADAREVLVEQELVDADGRTVRVDRLMVFDDEVWVIDFKTGEARGEEHHAQVAHYGRLVKRRYPGKAVKGFLVYVNGCRVEEVKTA